MTNNKMATPVGGKYYLFGLDISLTCTGVAIFDLELKEFVYVGSFNTENLKATYEHKGLDVTALKIHKLKEWFEALVEMYPPYFASIEQMVKVEREYGVNINEIKGIAKATGVIQETIWNIPQKFFYPSEAKLAIIKGNAKKDVVQREILKRYPDLVFCNYDESDACALALTQLIDVGIVEWDKIPVAKPVKPVKKNPAPKRAYTKKKK